MLKFKKHEKKEEVDKAVEQRAATTEKQSSDSKSKEERRSKYRERSRSRSPRRNRSPRRDRSPNHRTSRYSSYSKHDNRISKRQSRSISPRRRRHSTSRSPSPIKKKKSPSEKKKVPRQTFAYKLIEIELNDRLGKKVRVKCSPTDTIGDFKKLAAAQIGTDPKKIVLKKWYKEFKDHITLDDYELHDGMNVELYYR
ncbi:unnamed protein product [Cunninghamella blakesleeana]